MSTLLYGIDTKDRKLYDKIRGIIYREPRRKELINYQKIYRKTYKGWFTLVYSHFIVNSKERRHAPPNFTKEEFIQWINTTNKHKFDSLFDKWKESGYQKDKRPSIDRINNSLGYTLTNIRLVTWKENNEAGYASICKKVKSEDSDGNEVIYSSITRAAKDVGVTMKAISNAVRRGHRAAKRRWYYV